MNKGEGRGTSMVSGAEEGALKASKGKCTNAWYGVGGAEARDKSDRELQVTRSIHTWVVPLYRILAAE